MDKSDLAKHLGEKRVMYKKIRIVYVIDSIIGNIGGTERQLLELITGLDKNRFDVVLGALYIQNGLMKTKTFVGAKQG